MKYTDQGPASALTMKILRRGFSSAELEEIVHKYLLAKEKAGGKNYDPSANDIKICKDHLKGKSTLLQCKKEMGVSSKSVVQSRFFIIMRDHAEKLK